MARVHGVTRPNHATRRIGRSSRLRRSSIALTKRHATQRVAVPSTTSDRFESIPKALEALVNKQDLTKSQTRHLLDDIMLDPSPAQIAAMLVLLRVKGETAEEVAGLAESMQERAVHVKVPFHVLDIVGTGGDGIGSVNISTGASIISAAAGCKVAKHGNRSVSSKCGSADVLEALGVVVDLGPEEVAECLEEVGIGFMFAPRFSPQMRVIKEVRNSLKLASVFNILGPLLNPARAKYGLIGVYSTDLMQLMANALQKLAVRKALIVHSLGLDELTPMGPAQVLEVTQEGVEDYSIDPKDYGIPRCEVKDLVGGDSALNARILLDVFGGETGPVADALNLNAGFGLAAYGFTSNPSEGIALAQEVQRSGRAGETLSKWVNLCKKFDKQE